MRLLVSGNDDALAAIVDRYQCLVLSVALRIVRNAAEAEDVVQTVFMDIFRKAGRFDSSRGTLKVWLLQYAYTRSINRRHYLEQRQFYSSLEVDDVPPVAFASGWSDGKRLGAVETVRLVREALGTLNERQRDAICLVYFEGLSLAEAAEKAGETLPALRHNYYRGLMKLREVINSDSPLAEGSEGAEVRQAHPTLEVPNLKPRTI